jgi:hypothetical protein
MAALQEAIGSQGLFTEQAKIQWLKTEGGFVRKAAHEKETVV